MVANLPDLSTLSLDDKYTLLEHIVDNIIEHHPTALVPEWLQDELIQQHDEYLRDPDRTVDWKEAKVRILERHARIPRSA